MEGEETKVPWWAGAAAIVMALGIFVVAFVMPALQHSDDVQRAAMLAARAAQVGDLVLVRAPLDGELMAAMPQGKAVLMLGQGASWPRSLSPFRRILLVTGAGDGGDLPLETNEVDSKTVGEALIREVRPILPRRPIAGLEDVFDSLNVKSVHGIARHPCHIKDNAIVCVQAGAQRPLQRTDACSELPGAMALETLPGIGLEITLAQPHDLEKIVLRHTPLQGKPRPQPPLALRLHTGAVQRTATLAPDTPRIVLRPTRDLNLQMELPARGQATGVCLSMIWWSDAPPSDETWTPCLQSARPLAQAGQNQLALWHYTRATSNLACE